VADAAVLAFAALAFGCCAITMGVLQFRQGTLPPRFASARATSSPMATTVEQTLHRICIAPCGPLSRPDRLYLLALPARRHLRYELRAGTASAHMSTLHLEAVIVTESMK
jgi:hypothetical protein